MKKNKISFDLGIKIQNYLEYALQGERLMNSSEESKIIKRLSKNLKEELLIEANFKLIQKLGVFTENFSKNTLMKLALSFKEVQVPPNELIFKVHDIRDNSFYILRSGKVELFYSGEDKNIKQKKSTLQFLTFNKKQNSVIKIIKKI